MRHIMKKTAYLSVIFTLAAAGLASTANAQTTYVYQTPGYSTPAYGVAPAYNEVSPYAELAPTSGCIDLTNYLELGSTDSETIGQVTLLQEFLNRTGYLSGVSGIFDTGTYGAVINYQNSHGIPPTGTVGPITGASINSQSCGASVEPINYNPTPYQNTNPYQYNPGYYGNPISISSLSTNSGYAGEIVTIYGSNLSGFNDEVHIGNSTVAPNSTSNDSLSFVVPSFSYGTYAVYVSNSFATSNSLQFTVIGGNNNCYSGETYQCNCVTPLVYNYGSSYNYNPSYPNQCGNGYSSVSLNSLSSTYGYPGESVTIFGSGFSSDNSVYFGNETLTDVYSSDNGTQLTFTVPSNYPSGTVSISVSNGNGSTSNSLTFTVNGSNNCSSYNSYNSYNNDCIWNGQSGQPNISYISPAQSYPGSNVTIEGSNLSEGDTIYFNNSSVVSGSSFDNGTQMNFTVPYLNPGTYSVYVTNQNRESSNIFSFTIE